MEEKIAEEIDEITDEIGPMLVGRTDLAAAMALMLIAAHHVLHDDGIEDGFMILARVAWRKSKESHTEKERRG